MRILYVLHQFFPNHITGTEQYVLSLAREALERGHQVRIFTLEPDFLMGWPGVRSWHDTYEGLVVHRVSVGNVLLANPVLAEYDSPLVARIFEDLLGAWRPDLLHVFHLRYLGANLLDLACALRVPVVSHLMDFWYLCPRFTLLDGSGRVCGGPSSPGADCLRCAYPGLSEMVERAGGLRRDLFPPYRRSALRHTDLFGDLISAAVLRADRMREAFGSSRVAVAPSRFLRDRFEANGFDVGRVRVVRYGVDMARLEGLDRKGARRDVSGRLRVGFIGTIARHKGLHVLIEAFRRIDDPRLSLEIHGRLDDYPDYSRDRRHQASGDARIVFHGPFAPRELGRVLGRIDLLVVPSLWYENTPFVALEAMAAGVPVVVSRLGGLTEVFDEGRGGLAFEPGDAGDLAGILGRLAAQPEIRRRMAGAIPPPRTLRDSFDDIETIYGELMNAEKPFDPGDRAPAGRSEAEAGLHDDPRRLLEVRERQVRDLYDQLMTLAARWVREKGDDAPAGD